MFKFVKNLIFEDFIGVIDNKKYQYLISPKNKKKLESLRIVDYVNLKQYFKDNKGVIIKNHIDYQDTSIYFKLNEKQNIEEIFIVTDLGRIKNEEFFQGNLKNHKLIIKEEEFEIASGKMTFCDTRYPKFESSGYLECENGVYVYQHLFFVKNRVELKIEDVEVRFTCCNCSKSLRREMFRDFDKHYRSLFCENCKKTVGGLNDKIKWQEYCFYNGQKVDKKKHNISELEELFSIPQVEYCEKIIRKDKKCFGIDSGYTENSPRFNFKRNKLLKRHIQHKRI